MTRSKSAKFANSVILEQSDRIIRSLIIVQNRLYAQLESLGWLQKQMNIKYALPPLRGWTASPDLLVQLHTYILIHKPKVVVEFGSGISTIVIADALQQNNKGRLYSFDHDQNYASKTLELLKREGLDNRVDLRVSNLEPWTDETLMPNDGSISNKEILWYSTVLMDDISDIDLVFVDGPPNQSSHFTRYPTLPTLSRKLSPVAQIWMDDANRSMELDILNNWKKYFDFDLEIVNTEKGLAILQPKPFSN